MFEVLLILLLTAGSTSLLGSLLVVRNQAMVADALSHSVLLGIVLGFFLSGNLDAPLLIIGAAVFGVLTVIFIEKIHSRRLARDAATGLVFSTFFALAVLLISLFARNAHLDLDMVLMGEVLFAPFYRWTIWGYSLPVALVKAVLLLILNLSFLLWTHRRLKLLLFDRVQAQLSGVKVRRLEMAVMVLVALTTVVAFDVIGSIAVIAFMVAPGMTALIWSQKFSLFLWMTLGFAMLNSLFGYGLATYFDLTVSGTCAILGLIILIVNLFGKSYLSKFTSFKFEKNV